MVGIRLNLPLFGRRRDVCRADLLGFLERLLSPVAGDDVVGRRARREQVHRDHGKLQAGTALQKQHLVVVRNAGQPRISASAA